MYFTYHDDSPDSQRCSKSVRVQRPVDDKWGGRAEDASSGPKDAVGKALPLNEPFVQVEQERVVDERSSHSIEESLRGYEVADVG